MGQLAPASKHLEAVLRLCPDDWTAAARRAAALADSGDLGAAEAEYARAARVATPEALLDWYWRQAISRLEGGKGGEESGAGTLELALWYLNKVIKARPDDWRPWLHRSEVFDRLGLHDRREADEDAAIARGAGPIIALDLAADAAFHGRLLRGSQLISTCGDDLDRQSGGLSAGVDGLRATLLVHVGDQAGHQRLCRRLVDHCDNASLLSVLSAAEACVAGPIPTDVADQALAQVEAIVQRVREPHKRFVVSLQGALLYRAGRPADAIHVLERAIQRGGQGSAEYLAFLAMAEQTLGRTAAARTSLERYDGYCKRSSLFWDFWTRISHDDLLGEARAKILLDFVFPDNPFAAP